MLVSVHVVTLLIPFLEGGKCFFFPIMFSNPVLMFLKEVLNNRHFKKGERQSQTTGEGKSGNKTQSSSGQHEKEKGVILLFVRFYFVRPTCEAEEPVKTRPKCSRPAGHSLIHLLLLTFELHRPDTG